MKTTIVKLSGVGHVMHTFISVWTP